MLLSIKPSSLAIGFGAALTLLIGLIKGGAPEWASLAWVAMASMCLIILTTFSLNSEKYVAVPLRRLITSPFSLLFAFQLWVLLQALLISKDQTASIDQSLIGWGMLCYLGVWLFAQQESARSFHWFYITIIVNAVCQAIYGLWVYLSGNNTLLWMPKLHYLHNPTGFFVNANHFAAYLVLALILCMSHSLTQLTNRTKKSTFLELIDGLFSPKTFIVMLLMVTLIASSSLGAMTSFAVVLLSILGRIIWRSKHRRKWMLIGVMAISTLLMALLLVDYALFEQQLADVSHTVARRIELSRAALQMLKEHWLMGVGSGAFYSQFSAYRNLDIGNSYYNFAHNDLLQFWIEFGLIGSVLLALFVVQVLRENAAVLRQSRRQQSRLCMQTTFAYASFFSTLAVVVHSLVDFPLHLPGYSVSYLIIISFNSLHRLSRSQ